jgi:hypothetical protein
MCSTAHTLVYHIICDPSQYILCDFHIICPKITYYAPILHNMLGISHNMRFWPSWCTFTTSKMSLIHDIHGMYSVMYWLYMTEYMEFSCRVRDVVWCSTHSTWYMRDTISVTCKGLILLWGGQGARAHWVLSHWAHSAPFVLHALSLLTQAASAPVTWSRLTTVETVIVSSPLASCTWQ